MLRPLLTGEEVTIFFDAAEREALDALYLHREHALKKQKPVGNLNQRFFLTSPELSHCPDIYVSHGANIRFDINFLVKPDYSMFFADEPVFIKLAKEVAGDFAEYALSEYFNDMGGEADHADEDPVLYQLTHRGTLYNIQTDLIEKIEHVIEKSFDDLLNNKYVLDNMKNRYEKEGAGYEVHLVVELRKDFMLRAFFTKNNYEKPDDVLSMFKIQIIPRCEILLENKDKESLINNAILEIHEALNKLSTP